MYSSRPNQVKHLSVRTWMCLDMEPSALPKQCDLSHFPLCSLFPFPLFLLYSAVSFTLRRRLFGFSWSVNATTTFSSCALRVFSKLIYVVFATCLLKVQVECCFYKLLAMALWQSMPLCMCMCVYLVCVTLKRNRHQTGVHCHSLQSTVTVSIFSLFYCWWLLCVDLSFCRRFWCTFGSVQVAFQLDYSSFVIKVEAWN